MSAAGNASITGKAAASPLVACGSTKGDAAALPVIEAFPAALIANHHPSGSRVIHVQFSSATPAAQKTRKQSSTAPAGFRLRIRMAKGVRGNHRLVPFVLFPGNVAGMMIANQDHPGRSRLVMAKGPPCSTVHHLRPCFALTERVSSGISGIREHVLSVSIER